jgi:hypothetical protein
VFQYATRVRRADGQYLWFLHRNVPQWDDQGNIVMWYLSNALRQASTKTVI